jgi:hypothetical protein
MPELSSAEQNLVSFAREEFGESLTRFLLTGLGEVPTAQRWHFTITFTDNEGIEQERRLEAITYEPTDGQSFLPRGRDPLVLVALLRLLFESSQQSEVSLFYSRHDVLRLLGREGVEEMEGEINEAVRRYALLMFRWEMRRGELAGKKLSFYTAREQVISGYSNVSELDGEERADGQVEEEPNEITFNQYFIEGLKRRSLFGVDWDRASELALTDV